MATVWSQSRDVGSIPTLIEHVVASLDKALYDDYLCLVASNTTPKRVWIRPNYSDTAAFSWQVDKDGKINVWM